VSFRGLFWLMYCALFALGVGFAVSASAAECAEGVWSHPTNGYVSPSVLDICELYSSLVGAVPHTCSVNSAQSVATITYDGGPDELWTRSGGSPSCAVDPPDAPASGASGAGVTERSDLATTQEVLNALALGFVFFALVHGYSVGVRR